MKESLLGLLGLQDVDNEIDVLRKGKEDAPARIDELNAEMEELVAGRQETEDTLKELSESYRDFERQVAEARAALDKDNARLLEVKTNREYDAIRQEIETNQQTIDENETEQLTITEETERLEQDLAECETDYRERHEALKAETAELETQVADVDKHIKARQSKRKKASKSVEPRLLKIYDRIRRGRSVAVVPITRGACGGCFKSLPPQRVNEVRRMNKITSCEACGRILVWQEVEGS
ncbi:MAG: C4-type zinc ribbon domain-containing protein [Candidatus Latescibacteria bacterium]|jgi:hypothetical protein|nr:C4-type zinc ribbon domain-containing protein [Candidatus Latescibacterota bacterium]